MGRFENIRGRLAELIDTSGEEKEPKGYAGEEFPTGTIVGSYLEQNPPREELNEYWALYRDVGLIKSSINNFASEVIEPGWYITADSQETADELGEFMENVAVVNTERNQNFTELAYKMIIEREVRGTVFLEKVYGDEDRPVALYPLQNDTITIYTKPGKAMLPAPDEDAVDPDDINVKIGGETRIPRTEDGKTGAYVQFDDFKPRWNHREEVVYTRDEVVKWVRDADIGDARGTSRIRSIQERAEGWLQKVQDNDAAIRSKAWPMIIFNMGTEDNPWTREQVNEFLQHYDEENLEPGLMQAVSGDVSIEEFAGETADIESALTHDINTIMSGLPGPVYATGGFSQNVAPAVAQAQQRQFIKEVKKTRRDLENKMTPFLREVAEAYDLDNPDSVNLHIGRPAGEVPPEDVSGSIIRYTSDADPSNQGTAAGAQGGGGQNATNEGGAEGAAAPQPGQTQQASQTRNAGASGATSQADTADFASNEAWGPGNPNPKTVDEHDVEELADPRLVSTTEIESELTDLIYDELLSARDELASTFEETAERPIQNDGAMEDAVDRVLDSAIADARIDGRTRLHFEDVIEQTLDTLSQDNHSPQMDVDVSTRHRQRSRWLSDNMADSFENAVGDMREFAHVNTRQAVQHAEPPQYIADRLRQSYDDDTLRERASVMARVELMSAVNSLKMAEYDRHDDIVGVKLINPCNDNTTRLCQELACDDHAEAMFDADRTLGEQFEAQVGDDLLFDGFDPLPTVPPFHFNCRTEIVPVTTND